MHPIKTYCKMKKIKIQDFAKLIKRKPRYVYQLIAGYRKPSREVAKKLEEAMGGYVSRIQLLYPDE